MANADFSDGTESTSRSSRRKSALPLILAVVGGGVILVVLVCAGIVFWLFQGLNKEVPVAQASAEAFLGHLRGNRVDAAYAQTTAAFQSKIDPEQFRAFLKAFPALTTHESSSMTLQGIHAGSLGTNARFSASLPSPNGASSCTLILSKEGETWKIQHVSVP